MAKKNEIKFLTYKGKPLVRSGNTIYYGDMNDPFVIMLSITSTKEFKGMTIADRVVVQMLNTDPDCRPRERTQWTSVLFGFSVHLKRAKLKF